MSTRIPSIALVAGAIALLVLAGSGSERALAADRPCSVPSAAGYSVTGSAGDGLTVKAVIPEAGGSATPAFEVLCEHGGLALVTARLGAGQRSTLTLLLANAGRAETEFAIDRLPAGDEGPQWLAVNPPSGTIPAAGHVQVQVNVRAPAGSPSGTEWLELLKIAVVDGEGGEVIEIPLQLELRDDEPMFRDGFEPDPVLGQFSFRVGGGFSPGGP